MADRDLRIIVTKDGDCASTNGVQALLQVAFYIHELSNAGLFHQGWYSLNISVYTDCPQRHPGTPTKVLSYVPPSELVGLDSSLDARVDADGRSVRTRVFRVRYARELVELRTLAAFTLRLDALQDFANTKLTVQVDLLYSVECPSDKVCPAVTKDDKSKRRVQTVAHQKLHLSSAAGGLHEYCMVTFDEWHLVKAICSVHTVLAGFAPGDDCASAPAPSRSVLRRQSSVEMPSPKRGQSHLAGTLNSPTERGEPVRASHLDIEERYSTPVACHTGLLSVNTSATSGRGPVPLSPTAGREVSNSGFGAGLHGESGGRTLLHAANPTPLDFQRPKHDEMFDVEVTARVFESDGAVAALLSSGSPAVDSTVLGMEARRCKSTRERALLLHRHFVGTITSSQTLLSSLLPPLASVTRGHHHGGAPLDELPPRVPGLHESFGSGGLIMQDLKAAMSHANGNCSDPHPRSRRGSVEIPRKWHWRNERAAGPCAAQPLHFCPRELRPPRHVLENSAVKFLDQCSDSATLQGLHQEVNAAMIKMNTLWLRFLQTHKTAHAELISLLQTRWEMERDQDWQPWVIMATARLDLHRCMSVCSTGESTSGGGVDVEESGLIGVDENDISVGMRSRMFRLSAKAIKGLQYNPELQQAHVCAHRRQLKEMRGRDWPNQVPVKDHHLEKRPQQQPVMCVFRNLCTDKLQPTSRNSSKHTSGTGGEVWPRCIGNSVMADPPGTPTTSSSPHVFVFVHGFLGNSLDLRLVRDHVFMVNPKSLCLLSACNQDRTYDDLRAQGARLAREISDQLHMWFSPTNPWRRTLRRISFVGHSIGNLIIRVALTDPLLAPYHLYFHTFLSISGPHLGYLYSSNALFDSGIWFLKKMKQSECLKQLTFTDAHKMENCFLYGLAQKKGLALFKHLILVSSPQDGYVPLHSSRITNCLAAINDAKRGPFFCQMLNNILGPLVDNSGRCLVRADVHFAYHKLPRTFNSFVGRAAHLEFLETDVYLRFLLWTHPELLR